MLVEVQLQKRAKGAQLQRPLYGDSTTGGCGDSTTGGYGNSTTGEYGDKIGRVAQVRSREPSLRKTNPGGRKAKVEISEARFEKASSAHDAAKEMKASKKAKAKPKQPQAKAKPKQPQAKASKNVQKAETFVARQCK